MEGNWPPFVDPRETYAPLTLDGFGNLIDCLLRSGLWKEYSMVSSLLRPCRTRKPKVTGTVPQ
jgi:hypothetical protein